MMNNFKNEIDILNGNMDDIKKLMPHNLESRISEAVLPGAINVKSIAKRVLKADGWEFKPTSEPGIMFESEEKEYQLHFYTQEKGHLIQFNIWDKHTNSGDIIHYHPKFRNKDEAEQYMENVLTITRVLDDQLKIPNKGLAKMVVYVFNQLPLFCDESNEIKSFDEVSRYVIDNIEKLTAFPFERLDEKPRGEKHRQMICDGLGMDTVVSAIYIPDNNENIVNFYCSGYGFGPPECRNGSAYTGFYYSKNDTPYGESFCRFDLEKTAPDEYYYCFNEYSYIYTKRIIDHWYYFCEEIYLTNGRYKK